MTNQHPITPPPELVEQWRNLPEYVSQLRTMSTVTITTERLQHIATEAAQWGADQELEACCEYVYERFKLTTVACVAQELRAARRPKTSSLKEQALNALHKYESGQTVLTKKSLATIRRALEQLPETN